MSGKILCLHGFTQNGPQFAKKTSAVRKALAKIGFETVYLTAPEKLDVANLPFEPTSVDGDELESMRSWWPHNESSPTYYALEPTFEAITKSIETDGPYVGVMGFSQGAGLAGVLCQHMHNLHASQPKLSFAILYSGFRMQWAEHQHFYSQPITVPTLHVLGSLDTVVSEERSMTLYDACSPESRVLVMHPGGHFVPNSKDLVTKVIQFVQHTVGASTPQEAVSTPAEDWDEFDAIGRA